MRWKLRTSKIVSMLRLVKSWCRFLNFERSVKRGTFFANFTHAIGFSGRFPLAFPVLRYLMKPMYFPFDNEWLKISNSGKIKRDDVGVQFSISADQNVPERKSIRTSGS